MLRLAATGVWQRPLATVPASALRFLAEFILSSSRFFALLRPVVSEANLMTVEPLMMTRSEGLRMTVGHAATLSRCHAVTLSVAKGLP